ncbi:MAG: nucleotide sugar dehydrogenase [Chloroflexi bacterium]|nr:nucleotide sugar dehydrogenase [Chloroflexota bacterium]
MAIAVTDRSIELEERIRTRTATVAVLGLGYVGLPLAVAFARAGLTVRAIDVDAERVQALLEGTSYIQDVPSAVLQEIVRTSPSSLLSDTEKGNDGRAIGRLEPTTDYGTLAGADAVVISVPTPMTRMKQPNIDYICAAAAGIVPHLRSGMLVVLQSTTYPGTTEKDVLPILERSGLRAGVDFHLAFVPERINPGDRRYTVENIPTVAGGLSRRCGALAAMLFGTIGAPITVVSSPAAAELTKCYENTFRFVNIALANELAKLCERMGLDVWEVIDAAKTKPFGFLAHYPSAGVGGHCILVDPYYLACAAREYDLSLGFIQLAADINEDMPYHVAGLVSRALGRQGIALRGAKVLVLGVAFKKDIDDARNSPADRLIEALLEDGADVQYHDPYVSEFPVHSDFSRRRPFHLTSTPLTDELLETVDCAVIVQAHSGVDYRRIVQQAKTVVDACGAVPSEETTPGLLRLGVGARTG